MLSSSVLTQITPFQAKSLVEIACDANGSRFEMHGSEPKVIGLPGDFAKLCRILYKTLQDIPISEIRDAVKNEADSLNYTPTDFIDEYSVYLRSEHLLIQISSLQRDKLKDAQRLLENEEYIDRIVAEARSRVFELQGGTNIYMLYSRVADTRASLRKRACTRRTGNNKYFSHQPDLFDALENDYWEYLRTFPNMFDDDTLNMSKILGANREKVFYNVWFRDKFAKHLQGVSTVQYEGEDLPTWQILNTSFKHYVDIDLVDIMNRVLKISSDMFQHKNSNNTADDFGMQYTIFEYYIEKKLKSAMDSLNSAYTDIMRTRNHKIKVPFKLRRKYRTIFKLNTELGIGRRISGTSVSPVDASFRARVRNNKSLLALIDEVKDNLNIANVAEVFTNIERNLYFSANPGKDSNRPYLEHASRENYEPLLYTPPGFTPAMSYDLGVSILPSEVYKQIGAIIQCLCDLENLDAALERYGLSIVDMPPLTNLNRSYYEQVQTLDGLINDMLKRTYIPSVSFDDGYKAEPISGLSDADVNRYLQTIKETLKPVMSLKESKIAGTAAMVATPTPETAQSLVSSVFNDLGRCRILFNALTESDVMHLANGVSFSFDPFVHDLPLCRKVSSNQRAKVPDAYSSNKAQAVLLTIMQGLLFQEFDSQSSMIEYGTPTDIEAIAADGLQEALIRGQGKFIQRMLGVIQLVRKCNGHFLRLFANTQVMMLWKNSSIKPEIDQIQLACSRYDKALERKHRKSPIYLGTLIDELLSPDSQYVSVGTYLDYIGQELTPIIFPDQKFHLSFVKDDMSHEIIFDLSTLTTTIDGVVATEADLRTALVGVDPFELICSEHEGQVSCLLPCAYSLFMGLNLLVQDFLDLTLPEPSDRYGFGKDFGSCVDIFATMHYVSVALKAKINSILTKVLPSLNTIYQAYIFEENTQSNEHYHSTALLLDQSRIIHELNNMFNSIGHLSKYVNNDGAFNSFNKIIGNLGIPSYLNSLHIGFMADADYRIFQVNLMCVVLNHVLSTDAADWVAFARNFVKSEQGLADIIEDVTALKSIQMAATSHEFDPFPMYKADLMQELSSEQATLKLLTLNADTANAATLSKFMADKAVDPESGFVIWKNGVHFVYRHENNRIAFVHSRGLVFDRNPNISKFEVYTLSQAINEWRLFS